MWPPIVDVFEKTGADVKLLRCPRRLAVFFVETKVSDCLLRHRQVPLLLVVIKDTRGRIEIFGIRRQRGMSVIAELAQILRIA